ncbi:MULTISPECIES: hypothetical protein [unclassified Treponema]|uniref:hypothetical protein n=1 Tax=unclassified Treponema TaxID=2638727 RepID=UPI0020A5B581|nr:MULTISPECIES: hypothetical protein [unclassified Treponema]UTC66092.1 hypothetical protein E4O06_08680 [Treponema sp. OMZ 789]UTC68822.1 hypothetical protein E4O01_08820 [Treponema sp. OMZ 790]UTC71550.1 hypothetical protein E4O02_09010 [Treponema sp. OMZ 791]
MNGQPVAAAQIIIAVVPIVGIVMAGVLIFFYLFWRNKQIICQIQTKTYVPIKFNLSGFCLISGILLFMIGSVLTALFAIMDGMSYVLLGGLVPLSCGTGLLVYYAVSSKSEKRKLKDD